MPNDHDPPSQRRAKDRIGGSVSNDGRAMLAALECLAERAGRVILPYFRPEGQPAERKADGSPVTEADRAAEAVILDGLAELTPDIPVIAEEAMAAGHKPAITGLRFWLVDPLDGTREFVGGNGEFTVNIALIDNCAPVLGVVHAPALALTYRGAVGLGAWRTTHGTPQAQRIEARRPPVEGLHIVSSRSHGDRAALGRYLAGLSVSGERQVGSSLKFGLLAAGEADLYGRFGPTMEWDTAAGHAVLTAAGGSVQAADGTPLVYGKAGFRNPSFVALGCR